MRKEDFVMYGWFSSDAIRKPATKIFSIPIFHYSLNCGTMYRKTHMKGEIALDEIVLSLRWNMTCEPALKVCDEIEQRFASKRIQEKKQIIDFQLIKIKNDSRNEIKDLTVSYISACGRCSNTPVYVKRNTKITLLRRIYRLRL